MDKCCKSAAIYLASLRAISQIHQHNHWLTKGENFYGDHLLFERIYDAVLEDLDLAAEKFIGVLGEECLDYETHAELLNKILLSYKNLSDSPLEMSLKIEKDFIKLSKEVYDCFEEEGKLTLGLDDMIMSVASKHEESLYLLSQALKS